MTAERFWWIGFSGTRKTITRISKNEITGRSGEIVFRTNDPLCEEIIRTNPREYRVLWNSRDNRWIIIKRSSNHTGVKGKKRLQRVTDFNPNATLQITVESDIVTVRIDIDRAVSEIGIESVMYLESNITHILDVYITREDNIHALDNVCHIDGRELMRNKLVVVDLDTEINPEQCSVFVSKLFHTYSVTFKEEANKWLK